MGEALHYIYFVFIAREALCPPPHSLALFFLTSHNLSFLPITIATFDNFSGKTAFFDLYIEISLLMSF